MADDKEYVLWGEDVSSGFCVLEYIDGFEDDWKLTNGASVAAEWSEEVSMSMDSDFKKQIKLADHLCNPCRVIVASPALRTSLEEWGVPNLEFLPLQIINHKGKLASDEYTIVNLVTTQNCIDTAASGVTWNSIMPEYIGSVEQIVLDEGLIGEDASLFRAANFAEPMFVRRDLADALLDAGLTGLEFYELDEWE